MAKMPLRTQYEERVLRAARKLARMKAHGTYIENDCVVSVSFNDRKMYTEDRWEVASMGSHLINGEFQSDKYPTCPAGKVPLSVKDVTAQGLLWEYAQRRRAVDAEFADDLETALRGAGYVPPNEKTRPAPSVEEFLETWKAQDPSRCRVTRQEFAFIIARRSARASGVGYGWMRQILGIEWRHADPISGLDDEELLRIYGIDRSGWDGR